MSKIAQSLDKLAALREELAAAQAACEDSIPLELLEKRDALTAQVKDLEKGIKRQASHIRSDARHTLRGKILQLVHTSKVTYPKAALESKVPERYLKLVRKTADVWTIRKAAQQ